MSVISSNAEEMLHCRRS